MGRAHRPTALRRQELMGTMLHFSMARIIIEVSSFLFNHSTFVTSVSTYR